MHVAIIIYLCLYYLACISILVHNMNKHCNKQKREQAVCAIEAESKPIHISQPKQICHADTTYVCSANKT